MTNRATNLTAAAILIFMVALAYFSMLGDSMTMDEVAHLPAGYSYISQQDMRLNPEHPPLMKDMAGIGVWTWTKITGNKINFPSEIKAWKEDVNGQWDFGFNFMYESGNDANGMLWAGRVPMLLIMLLLGFYIFKWTKELFGNQASLLALFLYSFSPTFIAHGRLVTTDVAASAAIFIALYYFVRWLKEPNTKNTIIAGVVFGLALSAKFSVFLLLPLFVFLIFAWLIILFVHSRKTLFPRPPKKTKNKIFHTIADGINAFRRKILHLNIAKYIIGFVLMGVITLLVIYVIYIPHVLNYPIQKQIDDMRFVLHSFAGGPDEVPLESCKSTQRIMRCPAEATIWMASKPALRPLAQYFYGLLMVVQRASGGNTTYFLGEVSASGWQSYFPILYALKEPLSMHILTLIALLLAAYSFARSLRKDSFARLIEWLKNHIAEISMLSFIALYWTSSITSPLNIGVRHVLPTFPFIYMLTSNQISKWLQIKRPDRISALDQAVMLFFRVLGRALSKYTLVIFLLLWQATSLIFVYPYFLTYFNEISGGPQNGYLYAADSNLDWGQDLKRLSQWVEKEKINTIYVDYFGGSSPKYYLNNKFRSWWGTRNLNDLPPNSYLAVSATLLQGGRGEPVAGFTQDHGYYKWLNDYEPTIVIGNSIFVYYIP